MHKTRAQAGSNSKIRKAKTSCRKSVHAIQVPIFFRPKTAIAGFDGTTLCFVARTGLEISAGFTTADICGFNGAATVAGGLLAAIVDNPSPN